MSSEPQTTEEVLDEIERLDQNITMVLQDIDESFSQCNYIVSTKILPQIDRYAESSRLVREQARRWIYFFRAASAPSVPTADRRTQTVRDTKDKQQQQQQDVETPGQVVEAPSTTPEQDELLEIGTQNLPE
ncbi:DASH complex subunit ask1, partial [Modicella reniformis]